MISTAVLLLTYWLVIGFLHADKEVPILPWFTLGVVLTIIFFFYCLWSAHQQILILLT